MEAPNWRQILVSVLGIVVLGLLGYFGQAKVRIGSPPPKPQPETKVERSPLAANPTAPNAAQKPSETAAEEKYYVDIGGAIQKPGIYWVAAGARLNDLVLLAGGLTAQADRNRVNLALPLKDGQKILIPEISKVGVPEREPLAENPLPQTQPSPGEPAAPAEPEATKIVNLNSASRIELENLPGIGPSLAQRIVEFREQVGGFRSIEELKQVRGVGEKLFEKIRDRVSL